MGWQEERDGTLRCGRCFRDLANDEWGQGLHDVFGDGSMRCRAPEGQEALGQHVEYTSTFVVLESEERRRRIAEVQNVHYPIALSQRATWVCDGCMNRVRRDEIHDMADGEHVVCRACVAKELAR